MRTSDWLVRLFIFLLIGIFFYFLVFWAYPQYKSIDRQQPNRPSVSETINQLNNGKDATLSEEDYDDEGTLSSLKEEAGKAGVIVANSANSAKDALASGVGTVGDKVGQAKEAISSAGGNLANKTREAIASTPSIDDLVTLKEEKAKEFEEGEDESRGGSDTSEGTVDSYSSASDGKYMVVAGTYRQMINAETELQKLKKLGYNNATIAKFNNSTYASLIVDRFASSSSAYKYMKTLKAKGLDVYVHKKR